MGPLGQICIFGALVLSVYAVASSLVGVRQGWRGLVASGQNAAYGVTALITAASLTLITALATHDFSLRYVWDHSSRAMPQDLVLAAFYSGQQGSLLYWAWTLSIFSAIVEPFRLVRQREKVAAPPRMPRAAAQYRSEPSSPL